MEYNDMPEAVTALLMSFPGSFINDRNEFIADKRSNQYFILNECRLLGYNNIRLYCVYVFIIWNKINNT